MYCKRFLTEHNFRTFAPERKKLSTFAPEGNEKWQVSRPRLHLVPFPGVRNKSVHNITMGLVGFSKERIEKWQPSLNPVCSSLPFWVAPARLLANINHCTQATHILGSLLVQTKFVNRVFFILWKFSFQIISLDL